MELRLNSRGYGYTLEVISNHTTISEDVTFGKLRKDPDTNGIRGWEYQEPDDATTNSVVMLLEDIVHFRHNNIEQHTDTLIVKLMEKKPLTEKKNLLEILKRQVEQEEEEDE